MAGTADIFVRFGADTGGLEAALALTKANVQGMTRELGSLARQMRTTGAGADSELGQKMRALGEQIAGAKSQALDISGQMGGFAVAIRESGAAAVHGGTGLGFYVREMHALADEFGSGRTRQGVGTLSNLIFTFLQSRTQFIPYAAAVGAVAAAFGYVAYEAHQAAVAQRSIELGELVNEFDNGGEAAGKLRDAIERLANVNASTAEQIVKPFQALGSGGEILAQLVAPHIANLAVAFGKTIPDAAQEAAKYLIDVDGAGSKLIHSSTQLTQAQKQQYDAFVASGDKAQAQLMILDRLTGSLGGYENKARLSTAATIDQAAALQDAALAGGDMRAAEAHAGEAVAAATAKISAQTAELAALRDAFIKTRDSARASSEAIEAGIETALKVDRVSGEIKKTREEIGRLEDGIAKAGGAAAPMAEGQLRALAIEREKLKDLKNQAADPVVGENRGELARYEQGEQLKSALSRETSGKVLEMQIADNQRELADKNLTEKEKQRLITETAEKQRQLFDQQTSAGTKSAKDVLGATEESVNGQIEQMEGLTRDKLADLKTQLKLKQITAEGEEAAAVNALRGEESAVDALYAKELALAGLTSTKKTEIANKEAAFNRTIASQIQDVQARAAEASQRAWEGATKTINGAFDGQIGALMRGTESWSQAFRNVLGSLTEDLTKFFVNWGLQAVEAQARQIFAQNAIVQAHVAGNAAMAASDQASAAGGALAWVGNALKAIVADGAQTFAGVTAFLAPVMGPAAIGPAAAAQATVLAAGGAVASADIGMWQVPGDQLTMVHHNELIMPAAEAGAFRSLLSGMVGGAQGGGGGSVTHNHTWNINSNARDPRQVAKEVAAEFNRNPSLRPTY
jgi:hypothetical protein